MNPANGIPVSILSPDRTKQLNGLAYHLNNDWTAIVLESGDILMQHRTVHVHGLSESINLSELGQRTDAVEVYETLKDLGPDRVISRCMLLEADGSAHADHHGVSPNGEPRDPFQILAPAAESAGWYMRVNQDHHERALAERSMSEE